MTPCLQKSLQESCCCCYCPLKTLTLIADQAHKPLLEGVPFLVDVDVEEILQPYTR